LLIDSTVLHEEDDPQERELKLALIDIYNRRLLKRLERKTLATAFGLSDPMAMNSTFQLCPAFWPCLWVSQALHLAFGRFTQIFLFSRSLSRFVIPPPFSLSLSLFPPLLSSLMPLVHLFIIGATVTEDMQEAYTKLRPFGRYQRPSDHRQLLAALQRRKALCERMGLLREHRIHGITTFAEGREYEVTKANRQAKRAAEGNAPPR
jgi:hypothetical protein